MMISIEDYLKKYKDDEMTPIEKKFQALCEANNSWTHEQKAMTWLLLRGHTVKL